MACCPLLRADMWGLQNSPRGLGLAGARLEVRVSSVRDAPIRLGAIAGGERGGGGLSARNASPS
jgi:hypothetical protein